MKFIRQLLIPLAMGALLVSFTGCQTNPARKHTSKNSSTSAIAEIGKGKKKKAAKKAEESAKASKTSKAAASTSSAHVEYAKPEPKAAPKPAATVAKPEAKVEPKPAAKPEAKPAAKPETKPAPKPEAKVEPKPAAKPEAKPAAPAPKPEAKVEPKPAMKPETKPAAQPAKPAAKPEAAPAAGAVRPQVPNSFTWDYTFDPPGKRTWKLSEKTYTQTLPNGKTEKFNIVKPLTVDNVSGTLVQQEGTALQAFVPDKGSNPMHLKMRGSDSATWGFIGEMKNVDAP